MSSEIQQQIDLFKTSLEALRRGSAKLEVQELAPYVYAVNPQKPSVELPRGKNYALALMAVTHGNEWAGIGVLNRFAELLLQDGLDLQIPIVLALANVEAALANRRYLERDLNRSFRRSSDESLEDRRARELESVLSQVQYLVDFHQTIEASETGFAIFPYIKPSFEFARWVAPELPIVTHWGASFSKDGACSDEFVNQNGGVGITIELGQKGFDSYQESLGLQVALRSVGVVQSLLRAEPAQQGWSAWKFKQDPIIYTWEEVIPYPEGDAKLDEGWYNFKQVEKGQRLGEVNGQDLVAPVSGPVIFPKYLRQAGESRPKEICRIMRRVREEQLGQ